MQETKTHTIAITNRKKREKRNFASITVEQIYGVLVLNDWHIFIGFHQINYNYKAYTKPSFELVTNNTLFIYGSLSFYIKE